MFFVHRSRAPRSTTSPLSPALAVRAVEALDVAPATAVADRPPPRKRF